MKQCVQGHPASEERSRNLNQPPWTLCPLRPSAGPGWPGQRPAGLCPQTSSLNPHLPKEWALLIMNMRVSPGATAPVPVLNTAVPARSGAKLGTPTGKGRWEQPRRSPLTPSLAELQVGKEKRDGEPRCPSWRVWVPRRNGLNGPMPETMTGTSCRLCPDPGDLPRGWACVFICLWQSWTKWYIQGALRKPLPGTGSDSGAGARSVPPMDLQPSGNRERLVNP